MDVLRDIILIQFGEKESKETIIRINTSLTVSVLFESIRKIYGAPGRFFDILSEGEEQIVWPQAMPNYLIVVPNCEYTFYVRSATARHLSNIPINVLFSFKIGTYSERLSAEKIAEILVIKNGTYEQNDIEDLAIRIAREKDIDISTNEGKKEVRKLVEEHLEML